jgi:pantothenate kinase
MQTLQIDKNHARKLFPSASAEFKQMLIDTFGVEYFSEKITDRVKTFEDACEVLGLQYPADYFRNDTPDEKAYKQIKIIVKALNEGWQPDWNNSNQYKYYPWFYMDVPSGFSLDNVGGNCTNSRVGSRLCFKSRGLADYAAKQFLDLYKQFFTA